MSQFPFELAGPDDDADLRHVLASTPMAGHISVSFRREPSWFDAAVVDGFARQVVACRDRTTGRIFGFGCRSLRDLYVNGEPMIVGYLSSLRVLPGYRNRGLVARGYAFFRRLHQDGQTPFYLTTIAEGNELALRILTSGRANLPMYHAAGRYHTIAIPRGAGGSPAHVKSNVQAGRPHHEIQIAQASDLPAIVEFLNAVGPRRQFFPRYRPDDFSSPTGLLRGLELTRLLLAVRGNEIVGTLAAWDQHAYRQHVVQFLLRLAAGTSSALQPRRVARGSAGLPAPGQPLRMLIAALSVVANDDPAIFADLLASLSAQCSKPHTHLLLGMHEADPLLPIARRFQSACYTSLLYLVCWPDGDAKRLAVDGRPIYLEAGSL